MEEIWGGPVVAQSLWMSLAAAVLVLLVACSNVANLLLARGTDRAHELALRQAIGAPRRRILRQLLIEAGILAVAGGALGVALSSLGLRGIVSLSPDDMARVSELRLDGRTIAIAMAIALGSLSLFGLLPALRTLRLVESRGLLGAGPAGASTGGRLRSALVAVQVGVAVVLSTTTVLVIDSFQSFRDVDTGIETEGVWSFRVGLPSAAYPDEEAIHSGSERLQRALAGVTGIEAAGLAVGLPGAGWRRPTYALPETDTHDAELPATRGNLPRVLARIADPDYARIVGLETLRGRPFNRDDDLHGASVGMVSQRLATDLWGADDPVGRRLVVDGRDIRIVGVVADVREEAAMREPGPALYLPLAQWPSRGLSVVVRTRSSDPPIPTIREAIAAIDPDLALRDVRRLDDVVRQSGGQILAFSKLLGTMTLAALFLAVVGVYASTTYTVARRAHEIGIRMALGARRGRVRSSVVRGAIVVALAGLGAGLPLAWAAGRAMTRFVFGANAAAAGPYLSVALTLLAITAAAAWIPARRASAVDPVVALRSD